MCVNSMDILDAIGAVDDILIKRAKEKQKPHKAVWTAVGSIAACFLLILILPVALHLRSGGSDGATENLEDAQINGFDYVYVQIDVTSSEDAWHFVEYASLKAIHEAIDSIIGSMENDAGNNKIQQEAVKDESQRPTYSADFGSEPEIGDYIITLHHNDGSIREYRLNATTLTDLTTCVSYSLTKEQAEYLRSLIKK